MGAGGERFGWWYDGEKRGDGSAESFVPRRKIRRPVIEGVGNFAGSPGILWGAQGVHGS